MVLWTGGKDCALALDEARRQGRSISSLVTFAPPRGRFRAHPLSVLRLQARALGLRHRVLRLRPPFRRAYRRAFRQLRSEGIRSVVTGDIAEVAGCGNWVRSTAEPEGLRLLRPLWHRPRAHLLGQLRRRRFSVVVSYVDAARVPAAWFGRRLDGRLASELLRAERTRSVDASGENGEFHTWVLDGPGFRWSLAVRAAPPTAGTRSARWLLPSALRRPPRARPVR